MDISLGTTAAAAAAAVLAFALSSRCVAYQRGDHGVVLRAGLQPFHSV